MHVNSVCLLNLPELLLCNSRRKCHRQDDGSFIFKPSDSSEANDEGAGEGDDEESTRGRENKPGDSRGDSFSNKRGDSWREGRRGGELVELDEEEWTLTDLNFYTYARQISSAMVCL